MALYANARMYALNAAVTAAWRTVFARVGERAGIDLQWLEHPPPKPLAELWQRDDVGCVFICGYPWSTWRGERRPVPLAVPRPSNPLSTGRPHYWSDIVVRGDSRFTSLDDLHGARMAYTIVDSQSGYQALRTMLTERAQGAPLFGSTVGPLVTPRRVVDAVLAGDADGGPLDSYWHDLLRRHEPDVAARLRVVARTPSTPMPFLAAAAAVPADVRARLSAALLAVPVDADALQINGFAAVDAAGYGLLAQRAVQADRAGYSRLA
ncbi:MAG TPA: PhnD/SsuA/transferrin family substrate-binding protein [Burkholderiaceae bacterium]|nr:PhnD/SsuA/transferrin family substrate-binding protein [Burkholderiaceae bacterium]